MERALRLLLPLLPLLAACAKEDPEASLPTVTQQGLNTGGFQLDGRAYSAKGASGGLMSIWGYDALTGGYQEDWRNGLPASDGQGRIRLDGTSRYVLRLHGERKKERITVEIFVRSMGPTDIPLNRDTGLPPYAYDSTVFDHASVRFDTGNGEAYSTSARHTGRVRLLRNDVAARITAGTFEFTAVSNRDPSRTVTVTAGRFDRQQ